MLNLGTWLGNMDLLGVHSHCTSTSGSDATLVFEKLRDKLQAKMLRERRDSCLRVYLVHMIWLPSVNFSTLEVLEL